MKKTAIKIFVSVVLVTTVVSALFVNFKKFYMHEYFLKLAGYVPMYDQDISAKNPGYKGMIYLMSNAQYICNIRSTMAGFR